MCKKHKRVSVMATETPIETLRQALDVAAWPRSPEAYKAYTDARAALEDVEALVAAVRRRPCLGVARDGYEDECLVTDVPPGLWCWRCTALAKFQVEP